MTPFSQNCTSTFHYSKPPKFNPCFLCAPKQSLLDWMFSIILSFFKKKISDVIRYQTFKHDRPLSTLTITAYKVSTLFLIPFPRSVRFICYFSDKIAIKTAISSEKKERKTWEKELNSHPTGMHFGRPSSCPPTLPLWARIEKKTQNK